MTSVEIKSSFPLHALLLGIFMRYNAPEPILNLISVASFTLNVSGPSRCYRCMHCERGVQVNVDDRRYTRMSCYLKAIFIHANTVLPDKIVVSMSKIHRKKET